MNGLGRRSPDASATCGSRAATRRPHASPEKLRPILINGGFERVGHKRLPAAWTYQHGEQATADEQTAARGKRSLRLIGKKGVFVEAHQELPVKPGARYSVRCAVKRTPGKAAALGPRIVQFRKAGRETYCWLKPTNGQTAKRLVNSTITKSRSR